MADQPGKKPDWDGPSENPEFKGATPVDLARALLRRPTGLPEKSDTMALKQTTARKGITPLYIGTVGVIAVQLKYQGIDALIGRDILSQCILQYNGSMGQFSLAF